MHRATRTFSHPEWVTPLSTTGPPSTAPHQDPHAPASCATVGPCDDTPDGPHHHPPARPEAFPPSAASPPAPAPGDRSPPCRRKRSATRAHSPFPFPSPFPSPVPAPAAASAGPHRPYDLRPHPGSLAHPARAASSRPAPWRYCWPRPRPRYSPSWARASRTLPPPRPWARRWSAGRMQRRCGPLAGRRRDLRRDLRARQGPGDRKGLAARGIPRQATTTNGWDVLGHRRRLRLQDSLGIPRAPSQAPSHPLGNDPGLWRGRRGYGPPCCAAGILLRPPGRPGTAASTWPHPPVRRYGPRHRAGWSTRERWPAVAS